MTASRKHFSWNPSWALSWWGVPHFEHSGTTNLPANLTFTTATVAHPFASTNSERVAEWDLNTSPGASSVFRFSSYYYSDVAGSPPDQTKRWARVHKFLYRHNSTALSTACDIIARRTGYRDFQVKRKTDDMIELYVDNTLQATSTTAPADDTWYQFEVWEVFNNPDGSARATRQWVVRIIASSSGTDWQSANLTITTLIDVDVSSSGTYTTTNDGAGFGPQTSTTTHGAGAKMFMANICCGWEDADDPYGISRVDWMIPNATGHTNDWTAVTAGGVNVDETGTAVPDDATTMDGTSVNGASSPDTVMYDLTSPSYVTTGDSVISVSPAIDGLVPADTKGVTNTMYSMLGDGATDEEENTATITADGTWYFRRATWKDKPGSTTGWLPADLADVEAGARAHTNTGAGVVFQLSTVTCFIGYQKAGEKTAGLPRTTLQPALIKQRNNKITKQFPDMEMGIPYGHFQGVFAQPVVAPPSTRRRFVSII